MSRMVLVHWWSARGVRSSQQSAGRSGARVRRARHRHRWVLRMVRMWVVWMVRVVWMMRVMRVVRVGSCCRWNRVQTGGGAGKPRRVASMRRRHG